jgi:predicted nuclease of predicted toxin-antitoxin system
MAAAASKSKKRSVANWLSRLPKPPVFFLDRSLGRIKVATALRQACAIVEVHDNHFPEDAADEVWLRAAGENEWVALTKDKNIRYHTREKTTFLTYGVRAFFLTAKDVNADEMAESFVRSLPKIANALNKHRGAFVASITRGGVVAVIWPQMRGRVRSWDGRAG